VLIELRARDEAVRRRLDQARAHLRTLRARANRPATGDAPYRSDQGNVERGELDAAVAEENALLNEREQVRRGLAEAGIHSSLPTAPTQNATSCPARFGEMDGDERERMCDRCRKRVYDVDGLSTEEIDALVSKVQPGTTLFRRADGTLIAGDCPVGRGRTRNALAMVAGGVVAFGVLVLALEGPQLLSPNKPQPSSSHGTYARVDAAAANPIPFTPPKSPAVDESKLSPEEKAFVEAALVHPNRDKRLAAARALLLSGKYSTFLTSDREDYTALRTEIPADKMRGEETTILQGAILSGDRELLASVVRDARDKDDKTWNDYETTIGAIRCLLGDKTGGLAALRNADKLARSDHMPFEPNDHVRPAFASERADAHVAAIACGAPFEPPENDVALEGEEDALATLGYVSHGKYRRGDSFDTLVRSAAQIAETGKVDPKIRPALGPYRFMTPRLMFTNGNHHRVTTLALATVERAATRAEASAKNVAFHLWVAAAEERLRRGDLDGARKDAARAEADMPADAMPFTVPVRIVLGDTNEAGSLLAAKRPATDDELVPLLMWRAFMHVASSDWTAALADAREVDANAKRWRSGNASQFAEQAAWLRAALGWRTHVHEYASMGGSRRVNNLAMWENAPWLSPEDRRNLRVSEAYFHMSTPLSNDQSAPVRGAVLYLMGETAAGEGDVDVWLDALERISTPARLYFMDRATAATMRGDEAAAKSWRTRSAHWSALVHDDATAVLASVAGL
jgi:hypothetical protein